MKLHTYIHTGTINKIITTLNFLLLTILNLFNYELQYLQNKVLKIKVLKSTNSDDPVRGERGGGGRNYFCDIDVSMASDSKK